VFHNREEAGRLLGEALRERSHERPVVLGIPCEEADEVVFLIEDPRFFAVGQFYEDFGQVADDEVEALLDARAG